MTDTITTTICGVKFINLTPHNIVLRGAGGDITLPASGKVLRVSTQKGALLHNALGIMMWEKDTSDDVVVVDTATKAVTPFVAQTKTIMVVSGMVGSALSGTPGIWVPATAPSDNPFRNEKGHIVAVRGLKKP